MVFQVIALSPSFRRGETYQRAQSGDFTSGDAGRGGDGVGDGPDGTTGSSYSIVPLLLVSFSGFLFSIEGLSAKLVIKDGLTCPTVTSIRGVCMMCGVILLMVAPPCPKLLKIKPLKPDQWLGPRAMRHTLVARGVFGFLGLSFNYEAISRLPLGDAQAIFFSSPIIAGVLAWLCLGERMTRATMGLTCVAFAGMLFVARPRFLFPVAGDDSMDNTVGTLFALAGAFAGASVFVLVRRIGLGLVDWRTTLLYQSLGQTCLGLLWIPVSLASSSITTDHTAGHLTSRTWLVLALLGMVGLLSQVSMTMGMQVEKSGPASAMRMWDVVFAYIWQAIALPDDAISPLSIFGASLVMLSMVVIILQKASTGPKQAQASTASSSSSSAAAVVSINDSTPLVPLVAVTAPSYVQLAAVREAR